MAVIGTAISAAFAGAQAANTAIGAILAAGGLPAFAIRIGTSLLLNALANALAPAAPARGVRVGELQTGEDLPFAFPVGIAATAGSLLYRGSHGTVDGTPNSFYTQVIEVSSLPGAGLSRVIVDQEYSDLGDTPHPRYGSPLLSLRRDGTDYGWVRYYNGTQNTADADLVAAYSGDTDQPWSSNHILTGICYAIVTYRLDRENQFPQRIAFELTGIPLYDPRKDGSIGGSGAHRFNDKATWEGTDNPAVIAYNILRGIQTPEGDIYGGDVDAGDLPLSNWFAAMNECDEVLSSGRRQFRAGLMIDVSVDPADYLDQLAEAMLGRFAEVGGVFTVRAGALPTAVLSFTDDDVSIDHPQDFTPFPGLQSVYNGVTVSHPCQSRLWEPLTTEVATDPAWVTEDQGRVLISALSFPSVFVHQQARQIAEALAKDNRRFRTHQLVLPAEYGRIKPLDVINWTSPRNGYVAKAFEVLEVQVLPLTLLAAFVVREVDPDDYDWDGSLDLAEPPTPAPPVVAPRVIGASEWAVVPAAVEDEQGEPRRPALRITWDADRVIDALFVRWQVRVQATGETVDTDRGDAGDGVALVSTGIVPGVEYEVRLRPVIPGRETGWTGWKAVTAQDIYFGEGDIAPNLVQIWNEAFARHDAALGGARGTVQALYQQFTALRDQLDNLTEASATDTASMQVRTSELSVQVNQSLASFSQELTLFAGEFDAFAAEFTVLSATVGANSASISTLDATRVTAEGAVAAVEQTISAEYGGMLALAQATAFAESTLDGISSGFVWRLGASDVLSLVQVSDGVTPPVTTARIAAQLIRLDGDVQVTGDFFTANDIFAGAAIQSDNFVSGSTGWQISRNGNAQFNNLIVRGSFTADAVSDRVTSAAIAEQSIPQDTSVTVAEITLAGPRGARNWTVTMYIEHQNSVFVFEKRTQYSSSDSYTGWRELSTASDFLGGFAPRDRFDVSDGDIFRVQYRIRVITGVGVTGAARRVQLYAQIAMV